MAEEILHRSRAAIHADPVESLRLAKLAFEVIERIFGMHDLAGGVAGVSDLKARAEAQMGNACRILRRKADAADHFRQAISHLLQGSGDGLVYAEVFSLYGSYLTATREYHKALEFLGKAERLYDEAGKRHLQGKVMMKRAAVLDDLSAPADAVFLLQEALNLLDQQKAPDVAALAYHNLAFSLCEIGKFLEAAAALEKSDELARHSFRSPRQRFRLLRTWTLGRLAIGRGDPVEGAERLRQALAGFREQEDPYRTALVAFDLAALYVAEDRLDELVLIAEQTYALLLEQDLQPEAQEALEMFITASRRREIALEVVRATAVCVRRFWPCRADC